MKIIYNKDLIVNETISTIINEQEVITTITSLNLRKTDIRIELDSYVSLDSEDALLDISQIEGAYSYGLIDYNDLRKYLIINVLPNWENLSVVEKSQLKSYYIVPNDFTWDSSQSQIYELLVTNATNCRKSRIDKGRSYVSLHYINDVQKSMNFFTDTQLLMNQYIEGKIPALQSFINDIIILDYDYTTNGFSTKSYYSEELKTQLNYILFR